MGWSDRRFPGGFADGGAQPAGFFDLSFVIFRVAGIAVRVHILYIIFAAMQLFHAAFTGDSLRFEVVQLASLFLLVLVHEFGHCLACRWVGGQADKIVMWPLGGLAMCVPPRRWAPALITTLGGPMVHPLMAPIFGGVLLAMGAGWDVLVFNPFGAPMYRNEFFAGAATDAEWFARWSAFSMYFMNWALFFFNMLLPMFPMDAGRVLQEVLWWRVGYKRSMEIATTVGVIVATLVGGYGVISGQMVLFAVALFCGMTCWNERRRLAYVSDEPEWDVGDLREENHKTAKRAREKERVRQAMVNDEAELDRILEKIRTKGAASLTSKEQAFLRRETNRRGGAA